MQKPESMRVTSLDGVRRYRHPGTDELLVSVTSVTSATSNKEDRLVPWAVRLAAEYAIGHLAELADLVDAERVQDAIDLIRDQNVLERQIKADAGSHAHANIEALSWWSMMRGRAAAAVELPPLPDHLDGVLYDGRPMDEVVAEMLDGFVAFAAEFDIRVIAAEMPVYNRLLGIAGTLDGIWELPGVRLTPAGKLVPGPGVLRICGDAKSGRTLDATVLEQIAAYRRMREARWRDGRIIPMPATDATAILHLRSELPGGWQLRVVPPRDEERAWKRFQQAVSLYYGRSAVRRRPGVVVRPLKDGRVPETLIGDLVGQGYGLAPSALVKAGFVTITELTGWTVEDLAELNGIGPKTLDAVQRMVADHSLRLATAPAALEVA